KSIPADDTAIVVDVPTVRIRGRISARDVLEEVLCNGRQPDAFKPGTVKAFAFDEKLDLAEPGDNKLRITAKTSSGQDASREITVSYRPELPEFSLTSPGNTVLDAGTPHSVILEGRLSAADPRAKVKVTVLVNGVTVDHTFTDKGLGLNAKADL